MICFFFKENNLSKCIHCLVSDSQVLCLCCVFEYTHSIPKAEVFGRIRLLGAFARSGLSLGLNLRHIYTDGADRSGDKEKSSRDHGDPG